MATATVEPRVTAPPTPPRPPRIPDPPTPPVADENVVQLGQLMTVLGQDPKYRGRILGLIREAAPEIPIPELDVVRAAETHVETATKTLREQNADLAARLGKVESGISQRAWMETNGVTGEEMAELTSFAKDKKIGDADAALDYFRKAELGRPRSTGGAAAMTEDSRKLLYRNPKEWFEREATKIISESRRRRGA